MKKILLTLLMVAMATSAFAVVEGSKHDMRVLAANGEIRICAFCHTPHHANVAGDYMPLWSHETTAYAEADFAQYSSDTFSQNAATNPMMGPSMLCMSCHDGAVAPDAYYGAPGAVVPEGDAWNGYGVGEMADMSNDHPIGFSYDLAFAQDGNISDGAGGLVSELNDPDVDISTFTSDVYGINQISDVLHNGEFMTCASCHDVHNSDLQVVNQAQGYFLYGQQQDSQVCTMCHIK